jgi:hypothetical protein
MFGIIFLCAPSRVGKYTMFVRLLPSETYPTHDQDTRDQSFALVPSSQLVLQPLFPEPHKRFPEPVFAVEIGVSHTE